MKSVGEFGVWQRWMNLANASESAFQIKDDVPMSAAKMTGNILLVFAVWFGGLTVALISLILEQKSGVSPICKLVEMHVIQTINTFHNAIILKRIRSLIRRKKCL